MSALQKITQEAFNLKGLITDLLRQIDIGDFVDSNRHSAKILKSAHDLTALMAEHGDINAPDDADCGS